MADLAFYYDRSAEPVQVNPPDLSPYETVDAHQHDINELDERLDELEARAVAASNSIQVLVNDKEKNRDWFDYVGPIFDFGGDIIGNLADDLLRRWLDGASWKDALQEALKKLLDPDLTTDENGNPVEGLPLVRADFRQLASNVFACDRTSGVGVYGVGIAQDLSFGTSSRICVVPAQEIQWVGDKYGEQWATSMTSYKKVPIVDFGTLRATLSNLLVLDTVTASNCAASNAVMRTVQGSNCAYSNYSGGTYLGNNASFSSNVLINGRAAVKQGDSVDVAGLTVNFINASIDAAGNLKCSSLDVNGGAFKVEQNGTVSIAGTFVFDGPNKRPIVYDDQVLPRTQRFRVQEVLAGNIGTQDEDLFSDGVQLMALEQMLRIAPMSFSDLAASSRDAVWSALGSPQASSWMI